MKKKNNFYITLYLLCPLSNDFQKIQHDENEGKNGKN